jgi:hypothetical protein
MVVEFGDRVEDAPEFAEITVRGVMWPNSAARRARSRSSSC